jgi:hypothetical protein
VFEGEPSTLPVEKLPMVDLFKYAIKAAHAAS